MCQFISFHYHKTTHEVRVYDLASHGETEKHFKLDPAGPFKEGHYLPNGTLLCRADGDGKRDVEAETAIRARWPAFGIFFQWCLLETGQEKVFKGSLDVRGCDLKGIKLPSKGEPSATCFG